MIIPALIEILKKKILYIMEDLEKIDITRKKICYLKRDHLIEIIEGSLYLKI